MNRKGFTLIELIAVILILGIILVIAAPNISTAYKNSKLKSEEIFVDRLSDVIDGYIKLNIDKIDFDGLGYITKGEEENIYVKKGTITIEDIIKDNLLSSEDFINSSNKVACNHTTEIEVYKDTDFVYCYRVEKEQLDCLSDEYPDGYVIDTCVWDEAY